MSTGKHTFKHTDAARLMRATKAAGLKVKGVTLDKGKVTVMVDDAPATSNDEPNPLDRVLNHDQNKKRPA
jgi:hypothetical protein